MAFEYLRRKMKAIIWLVTILFVGSIFFIAGGSLCIKQQTEDRMRRIQEKELQERQSEVKPRRGKDELDPAAKSVVARVRFGDKESTVLEGELNERLNLAARQSPMLKGITPKQMKGLFGPSQLEELLNMRLAELAAESAKIDVSDVQKACEKELENEEVVRRLAQYGLDKRQYVTERVRSARVKRIIDQVTEGQPVSETRVKEYYEMKKDEFRDPTSKAIKPLETVRKSIETILRADIREESITDYYNRHKDRWRMPDRVKVLHLAINPAVERHAKALSISPEEITTYYNQNKTSFLGESRVVLRHIFFDPASDQYRKTATPSEADLTKFYEAHKSDYDKAERIWVSRILLKIPSGSKNAEEKKIEERAKQFLGQLQKGASFESLAKASSDDKASGPKGGDMGPVEAGQMSPPFDKAAFALKEGELSSVVRDEEGFQILKVTKKEAKRVLPYAEVTAEVSKRFIEDRAQKLCEEDARSVARELAALPKDFEIVAKTKSQAPSKERGGDLGELYLGENKKNRAVDEVGSYGYMDESIQKAVQGLTPGKISDVVKTAKGYHVLKLEKNVPAEPKALEDVRSEIAETLKSTKLDREASRIAREVTARLKAGDPFPSILRDLTDSKDTAGVWNEVILDADEKQPLDANALSDFDASGKLPEPVIAALSALQEGEISEPVNVEKKTHFFQLLQRLPAKYRPIDDEIRKEIRFALNPVVPQPDVEKYFGEHKAEYAPRPVSSTEWIEFPDKESAQEALGRIKEDPKVFDEFPKKSFTGEIRNPELRNVVAKLKAGQISTEVSSVNRRFVIARLVRQDAPTEITLDKVEKQVREQLLQERKEELYKRWLSELKNQAHITKYPLSPSL